MKVYYFGFQKSYRNATRFKNPTQSRQCWVRAQDSIRIKLCIRTIKDLGIHEILWNKWVLNLQYSALKNFSSELFHFWEYILNSKLGIKSGCQILRQINSIYCLKGNVYFKTPYVYSLWSQIFRRKKHLCRSSIKESLKITQQLLQNCSWPHFARLQRYFLGFKNLRGTPLDYKNHRKIISFG